MTPDQFYEKFELFAEAPNAVATMRELIVQMAIRGRLLSQEDGESASDLVVCAQNDKRAFYAPKKSDWLSEASAPPFLTPRNWRWLCIGDVINLVNGRAFRSNEWADVGLPIIRIQNLNNHQAPFNCFSGPFEDRHLVTAGDLLISWSGTPGTSFGAFIWDREDALLNQHIFKCEFITGVLVKSYLKLAINARLDEMISNAQGGVGLRHITKRKLEAIAIPLPPLAEQKRIVAKVDELMALCDQLEAQQQERDARRHALARASLARFHQQPTSTNLNLLFHKSFHIDPSDLRKAILSLAVQGKLVPQDPGDEPAENGNQTDSFNVRYQPRTKRPLPRSWRSLHLGQVSALINGDRSKNYPNKSEYVEEGVPWINTGHIQPNGTLSTDSMNFITREKFNTLRSGKIRRGDLLYCLRGATLGKTAIVSQFDEGAIASSLVIIRLSNVIDSEFAYMFLTSPAGRQQILLFNNGSAQPNLSASNVKKFWIPVPPLSEQRRIIAKVNQLLSLVADIESHLKICRYSARKLLDALVSESASFGT